MAQNTSRVVLVTGGTGLVGKALQSVLSGSPAADERWVFAGSKDADLTSLTSTRQLFDDTRPTHVLHLAAKVGGLYANASDNVGFWRHNVAMQDNINMLCRERKVEKLVSCLSTCIFPDQVSYPLDEGMLHAGPPHPSNAGYSYAKRMIDVQNKLYRDQYGCNYTSVIPTNVFGMHDNFDLQQGHVIPCLIHKCYLAKRMKTDFVVFGSGKPLRQFIYSKDLARLMIWALRDYTEVTPVILSDVAEISIAEVAYAIADAFGFDGQLVFDQSKQDGQIRKTVSNAKLKSHLPEFRFTPFSEALRETVQWFLQNYDQARK